MEQSRLFRNCRLLIIAAAICINMLTSCSNIENDNDSPATKISISLASNIVYTNELDVTGADGAVLHRSWLKMICMINTDTTTLGTD